MSSTEVTRPAFARTRCVRCAVDYRPARTDGECPICREPAPDHAPVDRDDPAAPDMRALIVVGMSALNLLFLGVLAVLLFG